MAEKGQGKGEKRLAASRAVSLLRKEYTWSLRAVGGPHKKSGSVALGIVLRGLLGYANNLREAKIILNDGKVLVDGKKVNDVKRPIGLFDLVFVAPEKKAFRALFDRKGRIVLREEESQPYAKICKVVGKTVMKNGVIQLATNDGRSFREKKTDVAVGDSLLVKVPQQKILQVVKMQPGKTALVIEGTHVGDVATIREITPGTMSRPKLVRLETKGGEFTTVEGNIVMVGDSKPLIRVE